MKEHQLSLEHLFVFLNGVYYVEVALLSKNLANTKDQHRLIRIDPFPLSELAYFGELVDALAMDNSCTPFDCRAI